MHRGVEGPRAGDAASKVVAGGAVSVLPAVTGSRDSVRSEPVQERIDRGRGRGVRARLTLTSSSGRSRDSQAAIYPQELKIF